MINETLTEILTVHPQLHKNPNNILYVTKSKPDQGSGTQKKKPKTKIKTEPFWQTHQYSTVRHPEQQEWDYMSTQCTRSQPPSLQLLELF